MLSSSRLAVLMVVLILHDTGHAGRIIGGHETEPHSRPYMVLLERTMENGGKRFCGGFLLSEDFMMTAAHCHAKTYVAVLGVNNRHQRNESQRAEVEQAFPHKDYKNSTYDNDLMILKFRSKVKLCHNVKPIDLANNDIGSLPSLCSVSGWGQTDWQKNFITDKLMEVNVTLIDDDDSFKEHNYCSKEMIGPGQGDSGGPLVCEEGQVYGVVSSVYRDNSTGSTMFYYTKIPDYKDWINSILKKA